MRTLGRIVTMTCDCLCRACDVDDDHANCACAAPCLKTEEGQERWRRQVERRMEKDAAWKTLDAWGRTCFLWTRLSRTRAMFGGWWPGRYRRSTRLALEGDVVIGQLRGEGRCQVTGYTSKGRSLIERYESLASTYDDAGAPMGNGLFEILELPGGTANRSPSDPESRALLAPLCAGVSARPVGASSRVILCLSG